MTPTQTIQEVIQKMPRPKPKLGEPQQERKANHVAPWIPDAARNMARAWMNSTKMPCLLLAYDHQPDMTVPACPNCGGIGYVYLRKCNGGPYQYPSLKDAVTWFDGDGQFKRGWYTFLLEAFYCPECQKDKVR